MNPRLPPGPLRAYRRDGKLVLEIDEHRFCADAFLQSQSRILDRDAFLAFACDTVFELLHDGDETLNACLPGGCASPKQSARKPPAPARVCDETTALTAFQLISRRIFFPTNSRVSYLASTSRNRRSPPESIESAFGNPLRTMPAAAICGGPWFCADARVYIL